MVQPYVRSAGLDHRAIALRTLAETMQLVMRRISQSVAATLLGCGIAWSPPAPAQDAEADALAKTLANPVAALISVPLQLNWDTGMAADGEGEKYLLNIQPVVPMKLNDHWNVVSRTIFPLALQSDVVPGDDRQSGLGDLTQSFFFTPKEPVGGWIVGAGPALLLPTATDSALGSEKWGLGPTAVALRQTAGGLTYGFLWNHIWSVAGTRNRSDVNATFLQPFVSKGIGKGITVSASVEATYDWESHDWVIPLNLTTTRVMKIGEQRISIGGGVRWYVEAPPGGPDWGLRLIVTLLYPK
jgi:hypothetical protein